MEAVEDILRSVMKVKVKAERNQCKTNLKKVMRTKKTEDVFGVLPRKYQRSGRGKCSNGGD